MPTDTPAMQSETKVKNAEAYPEAVEASTVSTEDTWKNPADDLMTFNTKVYDFGSMKAGEKAEKLFMLTNIGEAALVIDVVSACDCMQLDYTRTLIEKGQKGNIAVVFDSNGQSGKVEKTVDVIFGNTDADGYPLIQQLKVVGTVE